MIVNTSKATTHFIVSGVLLPSGMLLATWMLASKQKVIKAACTKGLSDLLYTDSHNWLAAGDLKTIEINWFWTFLFTKVALH